MQGLENLSADFAKDLIELVNSLKKLPKTGKVKQTYESKKTGKELTKEYKYTQLDTILDKIKENNNFALLQPICFDKEQNKLGIKCILIHKSGQSLVSEVFRPANSVAITKYAKPENLTRAFSLNRMAVNLGFSIGPALGGILSSISYNFLFITNFVALVLAGIFYVYFFRKRNKTINRGNVSRLKEEKTPTLKSPYLDGPFLAFCVFCTLFSICFFQFFSTLPLFYKEVAQLNKMEIGFLLGYSGFLIVMLEMLFVHLAEKRLTIAQTLFLGTVLCGASFAIIGFSFEVTALVLGMTILCFGEILVLPFLSTVTAIRSEGGNKGAYMGLNGITFSIAFIITPLIGTKIAYVLGFDILWMITAFLLFIAAIGLYYTTKLLVR